ncbi:hypothetical protein ABZZ20_30805 [Streptomyces sp. NPDC006430]|uniref:hypothetical protein n=1 Tax=Streptomyces sp. NPDC006430 TaxID=3154299 RepID=UPI0033BBCAB6
MSWEGFEKKRAPYESPREAPDLLIVATPDSAHLGVLEAAATREVLAVVEKPFSLTAREVARARRLPGLVLGVDHFPAYISAAVGHADDLWQHLGGQIESVRFVLVQRTPIEVPRLPSLGSGLTFDMLPHFLALLVSLGIVGPLGTTTVSRAGRHVPLSRAHPPPRDTGYAAETWSETRFELTGAPVASGRTISCTGLVGKGFPVDARFLELSAPSGAAVRLDLGSASWQDPTYPYGLVSLLAPAGRHGAGTWLRPGPARVKALGPRLSTARPYPEIVRQLTGGPGTTRSAACLFTVDECEWMMDVLEPLGAAARQMAGGDAGTDHDLGTFPDTTFRGPAC